jgi:hypothetical protein
MRKVSGEDIVDAFVKETENCSPRCRVSKAITSQSLNATNCYAEGLRRAGLPFRNCPTSISEVAPLDKFTELVFLFVAPDFSPELSEAEKLSVRSIAL